MGKWYYTVKLGRHFTDDDLPWEDRARDAIAVLKAARPNLPVENDYEIDDADEALNWIIDDLGNALETGDGDAFDNEWNRLYNWADENRVWIDTFSDEEDG